MNTEDLRRAAAYLSHYINTNVTGMNAVMEDADKDGRLSFLLLAVTSLCRQAAPDLFTADGAERLRAAAARLAQDDGSVE